VEPQDSYQGFSPSTYGAPPAYAPPVDAVPVVPVPQLRPLSTGEVLDRTFALYRRRFWLFTGIGVVPATVLTLSGIVQLIYLAASGRTDTFTPGATPDAVKSALGTIALLQVYFLPASILFLVAYGVSHAATVDAVGRITRGLSATAVESYKEVRGRWLRWIGIALRQLWSFVWPFAIGLIILGAGVAGITAMRGSGGVIGAGLIALVVWVVMLAGLVLGVMNFIRHALATPAGVQEDLGVNAAMRRSRQLVAGRKGRIFLALLLVYVLQMVAGGLKVPFVMLASNARGASHVLLLTIQLLISFVAVTIVSPVASIALCLFYVDERVRREGYDIELLMQRLAPPVATDNIEV
jgi:hypothetical protein